MTSMQQPASILDLIFFIICIIGAYLSYKVIFNARRETNEKLGYGPHYALLFGRNSYAWPKEFYAKDISISGLGIIKKEYRDKVDAWKKEYRRRIFTNKYLFIGVLLIVIGLGGLIIAGNLGL